MFEHCSEELLSTLRRDPTSYEIRHAAHAEARGAPIPKFQPIWSDEARLLRLPDRPTDNVQVYLGCVSRVIQHRIVNHPDLREPAPAILIYYMTPSPYRSYVVQSAQDIENALDDMVSRAVQTINAARNPAPAFYASVIGSVKTLHDDDGRHHDRAPREALVIDYAVVPEYAAGRYLEMTPRDLEYIFHLLLFIQEFLERALPHVGMLAVPSRNWEVLCNDYYPFPSQPDNDSVLLDWVNDRVVCLKEELDGVCAEHPGRRVSTSVFCTIVDHAWHLEVSILLHRP